MITIPLYILLFVYFAGVFFFFVLMAVGVGHLMHTGTFTMPSFIATFCCFAFAAVIFWLTWYLLQGVDWQQPVTLWDNAWFGNGSVFTTDQIFSPFK